MSKTDEMLDAWFEENVIPHLNPNDYPVHRRWLTESFRDYFSVKVRDELPPHELSAKLREIQAR